MRIRCLNKSSLPHYWFFVHMLQFHFDFCTVFSFFFDRIFGFPNPFIVHSRPSFLFEPFLANGFLSTCGIFYTDFVFFNCSQTEFAAIILVMSVFFMRLST